MNVCHSFEFQSCQGDLNIWIVIMSSWNEFYSKISFISFYMWMYPNFFPTHQLIQIILKITRLFLLLRHFNYNKLWLSNPCLKMISNVQYLMVKYTSNMTIDHIILIWCKNELSPSKKNCVICFKESLLKMMKNAFYFILNALFALKIFKFLSWLFGHVAKIALSER